MNNTETLGRIPPQAVDFEEAVLGALMAERDAFLTVAEILQPEDFYNDAHSKIFKAAISLNSEGNSIDMLTISERLRKTNDLDNIGGYFYIAKLTERIASAAHIEYHAQIIKDKSIQRKMISFGSEIQRLSYENDLDDCIEFSRNELFKILEKVNKKTTSPWVEVLTNSLRTIYENISLKKAGKQTGIPSGLTELDNFTGGWQKTNLIVLAGRPGMGKTSLMLHFLKSGLIANVKTLVFSLEMGEEQLAQKTFGTIGVSPRNMRNGDLKPEELSKIENYSTEIQNWPCVLNCDAGLTISEIETITEKEVLKNGIQFILIDYLQLITNNNGSNDTEKIANTTRRLKVLAKRCNIPVMALSQLNRSSDNKVPKLSDLRGSGAIEQDADDVLFIHREAYYNESDPDLKGLGDLIFAKHRMGGTGTIKFKHNQFFTEISDYSDKPF